MVQTLVMMTFCKCERRCILPQSRAGVCEVCRLNPFCYAAAPGHAPDALWLDGCSAEAPWPPCWPSPPVHGETIFFIALLLSCYDDASTTVLTLHLLLFPFAH